MSIFSAINSSLLDYTPNRDRLKKIKEARQSKCEVEFELTKKIQEIFIEFNNNERKSYENLLFKLSQCDIKDQELLNIIRESSQSIPLIRTNYNNYIEALFSIKWIKRSPEVIQEYHNFIVDLLAARSEFLAFVVSKLINCLVPDDVEDHEHWEQGSPTEEMQSRLTLVHNLLKQLLEVMPMISQSIKRHLISSFPYFKRPTYVTVGYIHNLLWILEYYPNFRNDIFELIFRKVLTIDINISRAEIEESENMEDLDECLFEMDNLEKPETAESDLMKNPVAETLDCCMEKLLEYFFRKFNEDSNSKGLWENILFNFDSIILPTHNTQHIQFLLFYICSFKNSYTDLFLNHLWRKAININLVANFRVTAIGYLSSFLARAKYIPLKTLKFYLKELCNWAHQYISKCDAIKNHIIKAHTVFYAICQAIFYIVAFRSRDLTSDNSLAFMQGLHLSSIVASQLNPLRVCLPAVATIFAGVTRTYQLAYCHTILERNARRKLATIYTNDNELPEECLESVFPFDPYLLKKSYKRIEPIYMPYQEHEEDFQEHNHHHNHHHQEVEIANRRRKRVESVSMSLDDHDDFIIRENYKKLKIREEQDLIYGISPGFNM